MKSLQTVERIEEKYKWWTLLPNLKRYLVRLIFDNTQEIYKQQINANKEFASRILDIQKYVNKYLDCNPENLIIGYSYQNNNWLSQNLTNYKTLLSSGKSFSIVMPSDIYIYNFDINNIPIADEKLKSDLCNKWVDSYLDSNCHNDAGFINSYSNIKFCNYDKLDNSQHLISNPDIKVYKLSEVDKLSALLNSNQKQYEDMQNKFKEIAEENNKKKKK